MTLKGKPSSFISACNELSIFMFNHQDINVKLFVKSLLRRGKERKRKGRLLQARRTSLFCVCRSLPREPSQRATVWRCRCSLPRLPLGRQASSSSQNTTYPLPSLYPSLSVNVITYAPKYTSIPFISSTSMPISPARHHLIFPVFEATS